MSQIRIENLTFAYPGSGEYVFDHLNLLLDTDWKLGITGRNGRGKTTLFRLLHGDYPYSGTISAPVPFSSFPAAISDPWDLAGEIVQEIQPEAQMWEIRKEMKLLELDEEVLYRPFATLSNGEQTKMMLAALFAGDHGFLLIDEPTSHLDLEGRKRVAAWLSHKKGFFLISHDRNFLDGCVDHILAFNKEGMDLQAGNFSSWYENFKRQENYERVQNDRLKKEIGRLEASARQSGNWSDQKESAKRGVFDKGFVSHKAAKLMKRSKSAQNRKTKAAEEKKQLLKNEERSESLKIHPLEHHANPLIRFEQTAAVYDGHIVSKPVTFSISQGERIFLEGKNGSGKTSLLHLLEGKEIDHTGKVYMPSGLTVSKVDQDVSGLSGSFSEYCQENEIDESLFLAILRKMGFEREEFDTRLENCSQGQKKKAAIARSLCQQAHLYIWDEPLNNLDVYARIQIQKLIEEFKPTMLLVEHDEAFQNALATQKIQIVSSDE